MRKILQLALLLLLPAAASAQVTGQALSLSGKPLPFAQITVCAGESDVLVQNSQQSCNGQAQVNPPAQPVLTAVSAAAPVAGTYQVLITYTNAIGETIGSVSNTITTSGGNLGVQVTSPPAYSNATGWNAYFTTAGGSTFFKQTATPTAIGTNYTQTTAINTGSANPPAATTATNSILQLATVYSNVAQTIVLANPFSADGNGRYVFFAPFGTYTVTVASAGFGTYSFPAVVGVPSTLLNAQANAAAITGTGSAATVYTYTLPASTVPNLKGIRITTGWTHSTGSASVNYVLSLNGQSILSSSNSGTANDVVATVLNSGPTTGTFVQRFESGATFVNTNGLLTGLAWTSNQVLTLTFNVANTDAVTPVQWLVEIVQ